MSKRPAITFADSRDDLPSSSFAQRLRDLRITRLFAANGNTQQPPDPVPTHTRARTMIEEDQPRPLPRPTPDFAADVDADIFNTRWEAQRQASHHTPPQKGTTMTHDTPRRPEETLREGPLKAAIWRNESEKGAYHSVNVARTYKDREGNLQDTQSFRAKDLLGLSELARRAHHHAHDLDREAFKEQRRDQAEPSQRQNKDHNR